jgi:hypothetical protein
MGRKRQGRAGAELNRNAAMFVVPLPYPCRCRPPRCGDEQTEIDDEISDQLKEDAGSRHDVAIMPQIPSGFGQNRGILFFAEDTGIPSIGRVSVWVKYA